MDSDYLSNESTSDTDSISSTKTCSLDCLNDLTENDICEITNNILEQIDSYMKTEIIHILLW
jgi:hypothetical protein